LKKNGYLYLTVFISGMGVLGVELSASRLLDPFFGNSLIIWANLIGLVLIYLSVGYALGGRWADQDPRPTTFFQIIAWGAFLVGVIPFVSAPILRLSVQGFADYNRGLLAGSLLGVLILFSAPLTLLAMASPFAIRLAVTNVEESGKTAGAIYAWSTIGSILGTFLSVLVLVPNIGTRRTFLFFAVVLLVVAIGGLFQYSRQKGLLYLGLLSLLTLLALFRQAGPIRADEHAIYETESQYNYIQVLKEGNDYLLKLNEGQGIHSVYNPELPLVYGIWDYFLVAPYFNNVPYTADELDSFLLIGSAAGTVAKEFTLVYGPIPIDGVEIDPVISQIGREFFAMNEPNLTTINQDGRYYLANVNKTYDMIAIDAYRPPYIPFQLTTQEFFQEVSDHLTEEGVVAINAGRLANDYSLVIALGSTMKTVFPNVYVIDTLDFDSDFGNSLVIGTKQPTRMASFGDNVSLMEDPLLQDVAGRSLSSHIWEITCDPAMPFVSGYNALPAALPAACLTPFTDDKAPVEQVLHGVILRYLTGQGD
jgi:predicted membrane-bound spermidine synthase